MAPEMLSIWSTGDTGYSQKVDLFSFGTMALEMICGMNVTRFYVVVSLTTAQAHTKYL